MTTNSQNPTSQPGNEMDQSPYPQLLINKPIQKLLLAVGHKLVAKESPTPPMTLAQVAKACRNYRIRINGISGRAHEMKPLIFGYFRECGDLIAEGIKITGNTERNERQVVITLTFQYWQPRSRRPFQPTVIKTGDDHNKSTQQQQQQ